MTSQHVAGIELSMIIPIYNERENLIPLVESIHRALSDLVYELIVVDDDSPDGTAELAQTLAQQYPIKVIRRKNERGLATAVVEGFRQAVGKILGVIDAEFFGVYYLASNLAGIAVATLWNYGLSNFWAWRRR